jgi:type IV secretory pathway TraG/TraD family ATPase VirD4
MNELREDALIVVPKRGRPLVTGRAIYFRRDDMKDRVAKNRFAPTSPP